MNKPDYRFIGKPIRRAEDERLITGRGQFSDDFRFDGQTYAAIVRSPYPHARIRGIDSSRARKMKGVLGVFTGADCLADKLGPIPHDPLPKTARRHEAARAGRRQGVHRTAHAAAGRQGAPCRRGGGDGGCRDQEPGARRRRGGRGRLRGAAVRHPLRRRDEARRAGGVGRSAEQHAGRDLLRRPRGDRQGVRRCRPRREARPAYRPRHRRAARAARGGRELRQGRPAATRSMPAPAARCGRSTNWRRRSASSRTTCASCPTTSAATSAPATAPSSNSGWCCGRRRRSAGR